MPTTLGRFVESAVLLMLAIQMPSLPRSNELTVTVEKTEAVKRNQFRVVFNIANDFAFPVFFPQIGAQPHMVICTFDLQQLQPGRGWVTVSGAGTELLPSYEDAARIDPGKQISHEWLLSDPYPSPKVVPPILPPRLIRLRGKHRVRVGYFTQGDLKAYLAQREARTRSGKPWEAMTLRYAYSGAFSLPPAKE